MGKMPLSVESARKRDRRGSTVSKASEQSWPFDSQEPRSGSRREEKRKKNREKAWGVG